MDSRREALIVSGKCRRQRESSLILEMGATLPLASLAIPEHKGRPMAKESVLRLAICYMKMKRSLEWLGVNCSPSSRSERGVGHLDTLATDLALGGGFVLVLSADGVVTYVGPGTLQCLGVSSLAMMGKSIREWTHPEDQTAIQRLLDPMGGKAREATLRFKVSMQIEYKMFQVSGKLFQNEVRGVGSFFVGLVEPLTESPTDNRFPLESFLSQSMFTTVHSLDMRFVNADAGFAKFLGYTPEDYMGHFGFQFVYPADVIEDTLHIKRLYEKGTVQTDQFRLMVKGGGYAVVYAAKTTLTSRSGRTIIISRHWLVGYECPGQIFSTVQLPALEPSNSCPSPVSVLPSPEPQTNFDPLTPPPSMEDFLTTEDTLGEIDVDLTELDEFLEEHTMETNILDLKVEAVDLEAMPDISAALDAFFGRESQETDLLSPTHKFLPNFEHFSK